ncbi:MAG: class I SAM-dependent methyltransferase [Methanothrix sp.]|nr:class I SAM-dependent methyltransferase [Methanothrix sp.]
MTSLERGDPFDVTDENLWRRAEHLGRYLFACDLLMQQHPGTIADIACGTGYGTRELCQAARTVIGVDSRRDLLAAASRRCEGLNAVFLQRNIEMEEIGAGSVDAIVSFETLEHLVDPHRAVACFAEALLPGGLLVCSVPNVLYESRDSAGLPKNRGHRGWFSFGSLCRLMQSHGFSVLYRLGQSWSRTLHRREMQLYHARRIPRRISEIEEMQREEMVRWLSYVAAYPTVEDVDGSYSIIVVARRC